MNILRADEARDSRLLLFKPFDTNLLLDCVARHIRADRSRN